MSHHARVACLVIVAAAVSGCGSSGTAEESDPEPEGSCHARVDGQTVDIVDVTDVAADARLEGSTLTLTCGQNTDTATGTSYQTRLSFVIKAFDGVGDYAVDDSGTFGKGTYAGNDGTGYETFKPTTGGLDSSCNMSVTGANDARVSGTFICTNLHGFVNDATGACCDSVYVNLTEGTFDLPLAGG
jgi:hypothetical protein